MPNDAREAALRDPSKYVLVEGEAGTGKTHLALEKACGFLDHSPDSRVLFVSFSRASRVHALRRIQEAHRQRRADWELRGRTGPDPDLARRTEVSTFHSLGLNLLRRYGHRVGLPCLPAVMEQEEIPPDARQCGEPSCANAAHVRQDATLCFDGIIRQAVRLLERSPDIRSWLGSAFPLIIVDEFQDTSGMQAEFLRLLSERAHQLFCLGDSAQRIFPEGSDTAERANPADDIPFNSARHELPPADAARRHLTEQTRQLAEWARQMVDAPASPQVPRFFTAPRNGLFVLEAIKRKDRELHGLFRRQVHRAYEATARRIPRADKLIAVLAFSYRTLVHLHTILETSYTTAARGYTYLPVRHDIEPGQQMHVLRCLKGFWWLACGADSDYVKREYLRPAADALGIGDMPHLASNGPTKGPGDAAFEGALQWLSASQAGARAYLALRQLEEIGPLFCRLARARPGPPTVRAVNRLFSDFAMELSARDIAHRVAGTRGVTLMLVHDAKNREFDGACVVIEPGELKGDDANQRLYVACTRARYWTSLVFHPKFSLPGPWNTLSRYALPLGGR